MNEYFYRYRSWMNTSNNRENISCNFFLRNDDIFHMSFHLLCIFVILGFKTFFPFPLAAFILLSGARSNFFISFCFSSISLWKSCYIIKCNLSIHNKNDTSWVKFQSLIALNVTYCIPIDFSHKSSIFDFVNILVTSVISTLLSLGCLKFAWAIT